MSRYDSAEHLYDWQRNGTFPRIHDDIYNLVRSEVSPSDGGVLDLGSSTGLLTRRLAQAGYTVEGIEADANAIAAGRTAGTYAPGVPVQHWMLTPGELPDLADYLADSAIRVVVARRVLPELDDAGITPAMLGDTFAKASVRHLFLEGRAPRQAATHRVRSVSIECAELERHWTPITFDGKNRAYLTVKE
ncbi:class I SAM-dependent methyltransferase [Nocardia bovistercoris]|uniref:Class I SAM-dependent methyltransferase n=1 Tax=Nocardia bovistercoris TaxID=2785916 RepID=A0A931N4Z5_9NOCA|nr:class I SAM-dependent methyltransferase [Nocardia bovistercoris]MBH0778806.1 class I SAM-dependent methyltransferase [Nocardia bovistercoris]